jgi:hypothetical protein
MDTKIPFQTINCAELDVVTYPGDTGVAYWQTLQFNGLRMLAFAGNR